MPPKRPGRRPPGAGEPSASGTTRTALHTQELILFGSPISAAPAKRSSSHTNHRASRTSSSSVASGAKPPTTSSTTSQRHHAAPAHSSSISSLSILPASRPPPVPDYEPLPDTYHTVPCAPVTFSSEISLTHSSGLTSTTTTPAAATAPPTAASVGRVPSPPPSRDRRPTAGRGGIVASGAGTRVIRLLRDARAAVQDPIRPETPLDAFRSASGTATGAAASGLAGEGTVHQASAPRHPPQGLESRLRRRLPAGGRLAPMPPSEASPNTDTNSHHASPVLRPGCSPPSPLPSSSGLSSPMDGRAGKASRQTGQPASSTTITSNSSSTGLSADEFATRYTAAQQKGEAGLAECVELLYGLKQWLGGDAAARHAHALNGAATACLQTSLLQFNQLWPTGASLRGAVDDCTLLNAGDPDGTLSSTSGGGGVSAQHTPLTYAQVAVMAAATMLNAYPAASLTAEPISFHAVLAALHTVAECGLAEWISTEEGVLAVLLELLRLLTHSVSSTSTTVPSDAMQGQLQHMVWVLEIIAYGCEEALLAALRPTSGGSLKSAVASPQHSTASANRTDELDLICGSGLADDAVPSFDNGQPSPQRAMSASLLSGSGSLHRMPPPAQQQTRNSHTHSPIGTFIVPQGSPTSFVKRGGSSNPQQQTVSYEAVTAYLVSLGIIHALQEISVHVMQQTTASLHAAMPALFPVVGSLYRLLAQSHAAALRASGAVNTLVSMLQYGASDAATVESVARALVKLTYDGDCLADMRQPGNTVVLDTATQALLTQVRLHADASTSDPASIQLLVSRLCGVMARVAEGSTEQQDHLASPAMTHVLELVAQRYLSTASSGSPGDGSGAASRVSPSLAPAPVIQAVVWVLGIAAMSPHCSLHLVEHTTPLLVGLLEHLRAAPSTQLTAVYVLMCLSNLSYFFNRLEPQSDPAMAQVDSAEEAQRRAEWLTTISSSLGLLLAHYLFEDNVEATVEATRVLGNISYTNAGRDWMEANCCDEVIVLFLGHEDLRIVYNCCGILLNLTAASPCRVVETPELLKMMLSYTARYTKDDTISAAAVLEQQRLRQQRQSLASASSADDERELAAEAKSSADQIADLVEKLLANVHGLLTLPTAERRVAGV